MKVTGIIQARMGSRRLPGKVLKPILGIPMLQHMVERLKRCRWADEIVIATSEDPQDAIIRRFGEEKGYLCSVGPEEDVLGRYYQAAKERGADVILRLTGDCPLIDPEITDAVTKRHLEAKKNDLTSNVFTRSYPRGLDTEALSFRCLERIHRETNDLFYREHVTNYVHDYPEMFIVENVSHPSDLSRLRWCVDTPEDFEFVTKVYEALYPGNPSFRFQDVLTLIEHQPELVRINAHVPQVNVFRRKTRA